MNEYGEELKNLYHSRIYHIIVVGCTVTLLFGLLDLVIVPNYFYEFLLYRLGVVICGIFLLYVNFHDRNYSFAMVIGLACFLCASSAVLFMIYRMGGASSPYYAGLIVIMTIYSTLAPLTFQQSLLSGFLLVMLYIWVVLLKDTPHRGLWVELFTNGYFMVCFVFIIATQSLTDTAARKREYLLRKQEKEGAAKLAEQASMLEDEVIKRSREQASSEERYRLLFHQIADEIAVVDVNGLLIQSNLRFDKSFTTGKEVKSISIFSLIDEEDRFDLSRLFNQMVISGEPLSSYHVHMHRIDGSSIEVELSANLIQRGGELYGILLILRDIGSRRMMEKKLLETLEIKKKTETAAILALAKLSEFRDGLAGNHLERIREYCLVIADALSQEAEFQGILNDLYLEDIYNASILHDIGKVAVPDEYLVCATKLSDQEQEQVRRHTLVGGDIIRDMEDESQGSGFLTMAKHIAYFHHERWDGEGYPYGLAGREIPLAARIVSLADFYEMLTSPMSGTGKPKGHHEAVACIREMTGKSFDPAIVSVFLKRERSFARIRAEYPENSE